MLPDPMTATLVVPVPVVPVAVVPMAVVTASPRW